MGSDQTTIGDELERMYQLENLVVRSDELLVVGLRQSFANLATPSASDGPMDHPTKGLVIKCGHKCADAEDPVSVGMVCYFPKFKGQETEIKNKRLFVVKEEDAKVIENVSDEEIYTMLKNTY